MTSLTSELIRKNRDSFRAAPDWLPGHVYQASRYCYGVSSAALALLNEPIDEDPTYTDLLAAVALELRRPVNYLEIGVSVGKNFYALARALDRSNLFGIDWEAPSPVLEALLARVPASKPGVSTYQVGSNIVHYVQGDEFAAQTWQPLVGTQFDIVFSDAWHQGTALLTEFEMLSTFGLINPRQFFLMWDDLNNAHDPSMDRAYARICDRLRRQTRHGVVHSGIVPVNGWLGQHEPPHVVGWATNLDITPLSLNAALQNVRGADRGDRALAGANGV